MWKHTHCRIKLARLQWTDHVTRMETKDPGVVRRGGLSCFCHLDWNQMHFNFFSWGSEVYRSKSLLYGSSLVFEPMEPLSFTETRDETTVYTIYAGIYIHETNRGHSVRLPLNPPLRRGRSRFKFKWHDDLEASVIKARIMDWRGRETVSRFGHSLLHGIIVPRCFKIFLHESVKYGR